MSVTTTYNRPKAFSFSYSKLKNFEVCPKRHLHVDILKDFKEDEGEALLYGNQLHDAMHKRLGDKRVPLPKPFEHLEPWAVKVIGDGRGKLLVEQKLAIRQDMSACDWFDKQAWFRGIGDVIKIIGPVALILDWKTGRVLEDGSQLALMAQVVFSHYPEVMRVRSEFVWLKEDATTRADFTRDDMIGVWGGLLPRVQLMEEAAKTTTYPAKPGNLCRRWCPVTSCPHNGN